MVIVYGPEQLMIHRIKVRGVPTNIYLGGINPIVNKSELQKHNIRYVISAMRLFEQEKACLDSIGINASMRCEFDVRDVPTQDVIQYFPAVNRTIHDESARLLLASEGQDVGGGVYIHCEGGYSRSVTLLAAYLCRHHGMDHTEAKETIRVCRDDEYIEMNKGFEAQLGLYSEKLMDVDDAAILNHSQYNIWRGMPKVEPRPNLYELAPGRRRMLFEGGADMVMPDGKIIHCKGCL